MTAWIAAAILLGSSVVPAPDEGSPEAGSGSTPAEPAAAADSRSALEFAESLAEEGDYYRAITEAKRFLFFHPDEPAAAEARLLIGRAYLAGGQWTAAAAVLVPLAVDEHAGKVGAEAAYALGEARMGAGDFDLAALEFRRFAEDHPTDPRAPLADVRLAWARVLAADALSRRSPAKGRVAFASVARTLKAMPEDHPERERIEVLAEGAGRLAALPRRSPALAGSMSAIVPGLGQIYASRYADGLIAFVVNGLFIAGAYESFHRGNNVAGAVLVLFELGWYSGNIYSAINSAHRFNDDRRTSRVRALDEKLTFRIAPRVSAAGGGAQGVQFVLGGTF